MENLKMEHHCRMTWLMLFWRLNCCFSCAPKYSRYILPQTAIKVHACWKILCELWNRTFISWSFVLLGLISYSRGCWAKAAIFKMSLILSSTILLRSLKACRKGHELEMGMQRPKKGDDGDSFTLSLFFFSDSFDGRYGTKTPGDQ